MNTKVLEDIEIGDVVFINPHGEGCLHHGTVTKVTLPSEEYFDGAVEVDMWLSEDGENKVSGKVAMPLVAVEAVAKCSLYDRPPIVSERKKAYCYSGPPLKSV
jgi:hypothetical protein